MTTSYKKVLRNRVENELLCGDQCGLAGHALPCLLLFNPGVGETFAVNVRFAFLGSFHAKNSDDDGGIAVDLNVHFFIEGLRWLIVGRFDAGEKLAFVGHAAVNFDGDEGFCQKHVQRFGVLLFDGVAPGGFEAEDTAAFVAGIVLTRCGNRRDRDQGREDSECLFHRWALSCAGTLFFQSKAHGGSRAKKSFENCAECNWEKERAAEWAAPFTTDNLFTSIHHCGESSRKNRGMAQSRRSRGLGDGDFGAEIDVLNRVEEFYPLVHWALEGFAAADEAGAAGALVDDGGGDRFLEIVRAAGAAAVDESRAAHVAIRDLIAAEINGVIAREVGVDALIEFAVAGIADVERLIAAVIFRELLLDDVGFDGDAEMIGLAGKVGREVVILVFFKGVVAEIAPENGGHAEFMRVSESLADFDDLAAALIRTEINCGADGGCAHVVCLLDGAEENLVGFVGIGEELVVIELYEEGDFVRVFAGDGAEDAEGGSDGVATAFDGELDDVFAVKIVGIFREAGAGGVLDALVHGKNGEIAGAAEAAGVEHTMEAGEDARITVRWSEDAVYEIRAGKVKAFLGDFRRAEAEE